MASRGGGSYFSARDIEVLREQAKQRLEQSQIDSQVNSFLQEQLVTFNDRDVDKINGYLEEIESALKDRVEAVDRLQFGGSVAKHTYVDGLSDVDLLVILRDADLANEAPPEMRERFREALLRQLPQGNVSEIEIGRLAVTVRYTDGTKIQLLPAVRVGEEISISSADGQSWTQIQPRDFAQRLTEINRLQGGSVVPSIKLAKAILANRLGDKCPSGYHVEALAVSAFRDYTGPRTPKSMLIRLFERANEDVLRPIRDVTGQSSYVDDDLGPAQSPSRRELSWAFGDIAKTMASSRSTADWRALLE